MGVSRFATIVYIDHERAALKAIKSPSGFISNSSSPLKIMQATPKNAIKDPIITLGLGTNLYMKAIKTVVKIGEMATNKETFPVVVNLSP